MQFSSVGLEGETSSPTSGFRVGRLSVLRSWEWGTVGSVPSESREENVSPVTAFITSRKPHVESCVSLIDTASALEVGRDLCSVPHV